jgi:signal transduction histidine kinase
MSSLALDGRDRRPDPEGALPLRAWLTEAADHAAAAWVERYPEVAPQGVVRDSLALLVGALEEPPGTRIAEGVASPASLVEVRIILLRLLRRRFVRTATASAEVLGTPAVLLPVFLRFEEVSEALDVTGEAQVEAGLSGPRARELLAEVGHDMRSPLTSVLFLSEVLSASPGIRDDRHQLRQLGLIHSAAVTMLTLVNNFIELARTEQGPDEARPSPFSLSDLLEGLLRTLRPLADEKGLALVVQNRVMGPDRRTGFAVPLSRVLLNLGSNAIRYTGEGRVTFEVSEPAPGLVSFVVEDTGPGMDTGNQRSLEDVFEPSATGSGVHFSGSGLGLVIVRKLLRKMGSELDLQSEAGVGTRVAFTLLLAEAG